MLNRLGLTRECDGQTDGQADILIANAALSYVAQPKIRSVTRGSRPVCSGALAIGLTSPLNRTLNAALLSTVEHNSCV